MTPDVESEIEREAGDSPTLERKDLARALLLRLEHVPVKCSSTCDTARYSAVQVRADPGSNVQCSTVQYTTAHYTTLQYIGAPRSVMACGSCLPP